MEELEDVDREGVGGEGGDNLEDDLQYGNEVEEEVEEVENLAEEES